MATSDKKKKVINRQSVHVVYFSCGNCGEECEHIHFCSDCGKPMRVINVVEKFGEEAEELIKKLENSANGSSDDFITPTSEESPNIIVLGEDEHIDSTQEDGSVSDDDSAVLVDIFPDDDDDSTPKDDRSGDLDEMEEIVAALDQVDDDGDLPSFEGDDIPEL